MSAQSQTLIEWVTELNDTLFIQPSAELALKAVHDQVDPSLVVNSGTLVQGTFSVILQWENPEIPEGMVAVLSKTTFKENATGKETKKTNVILWEVKWIDGKRKLTGQTEVEAGQSSEGPDM
ncbi:hypothetical protein BTUL_0139g00260 [Botrytis tulipae]|uniref:Uncharacterized protein n=1 Tax=Botrytis tulipae TaxID=87230 RepID=A0A4Z1EGC6_9HELO|nr:hypothetical protein BTUL_0139g00260 [Botrytis tulipae]